MMGVVRNSISVIIRDDAGMASHPDQLNGGCALAE